jgi:uncharacterized protein with HEPN domain
MHIRDSCQRIAEYVAEGGLDWSSRPIVMAAVCRNITIIGEAARNLEEPFRRKHAEVPWSGLIGARDIVMHAYEHLEYLKPELIREMAEKDVPELLNQCLRLLSEE